MTLKNPRLAVNGGRPVRTRPWSSGPFHFEDELRALRRLFARGPIPLARGVNVLALRKLLAKTYGVGHVVTVSSGSAALHVAMAAAGVGPGDEVIVPPFTDYGTVVGIFQLNAVPVFCDLAPDSVNLDPAALAALITARTKAIVPVHVGGYPADMPAIMQIARRRGVRVIEDCAQTHLARLGGTMVGCFGDFGAFSTNESKHMKTGEGGFIICRREKDAFFADLFADKCYHRFPEAPPTPAFPAMNLRMSEINAAIGIEQLKRLPGWVAQRRAAGRKLERAMSRYPLKPMARPAGARCSYWVFDFFLDAGRTDITPQEFAQALNAEGIPCSPPGRKSILNWDVFEKLNANPRCFPNYRPGRLRKGQFAPDRFPNMQRVERELLTLPVNPYTGFSEIRDFAAALEKIFKT
jgi:dTDP-4-amino-4,6-dideoxygalactose transaminase